MATYDKRHSISMIASAAVLGARLVSRVGAHAATSAEVMGISESAAALGKSFSAITFFSGLVEASEVIPDGSPVKPAADGTGRVAVGTDGDNCGWAVYGANKAGAVASVHVVESRGAVSVAGESYLGVVATRCYSPSMNHGNGQAMARTMHIARQSLDTLQLLYSNWSAAGEAGNGGVSSFRAAIEYPAGTISGQILFSGSATGTAASGTNIVSDALKLASKIPKGAKFWVRTWHSNPAGSSFVAGIGSTGMDMITAAPSGVVDNTMNPGANPGAATTTILCPTAILAWTTQSSFLISGDSIGHGSSDVNTAADVGDQGIFARSLGPIGGYISIALPGESVSGFNASHANRAALQQYCSHIVTDYGTQDLGGGAAAWLTNITAFVSYFGGKPVYLSTLIPRTTSTDGWITTGNQTVTVNESQRLIINGHIRNGNVPGVSGYFDTERVFESAYRSGLWNWLPGSVAPATPTLTDDGTHPNRMGYRLVQAQGAIQGYLFK